MYRMTDDEFEAVVQQAVDTLPERLAAALDNVAIVLEDEPDEDQLADSAYGTEHPETGDLLGLYDGLALTERGADYGEYGMDLPDMIWVFKGPHERLFSSRAQVLEEVRKTVIHEIGHYFGLDEDQIAAMGYD